MAGSAAVLEDSSLLSKLDRMLLPLERFAALLSGLAIFSLMFLAAYSVTARKFFGAPMMGYVDYIEAAMPIIAIMGVSYVQRDGTHIRMDMLVSALKGRALWFFELFSVLLILVLIVALTYGAWAHFDRSFDCARPLCSATIRTRACRSGPASWWCPSPSEFWCSGSCCKPGGMDARWCWGWRTRWPCR